MLGDRLHAHPVRRRQLPHGGVAVGQPRDQIAPGRIGQGREHLRQRVTHLGLNLNHLVEIDPRPRD